MRLHHLVPAVALTLLAPLPALAEEPPSPSPTHVGGSPDYQPPSPTPTTAHADPVCPRITMATYPTVVISGGRARVEATVEDGRGPVDFVLDRQSPGPAAVVRVARAATSTVFTLDLGETHHFILGAARGGQCVPEEPRRDRIQFTVAVRSRVTIAARRNAVRNYTFTGRVQPAYGSVDLYRVEADGRRVLTARALVQRDGTYSIERRFTGSGRFGFVAVANPGSTGRYTGGESMARPTVVH